MREVLQDELASKLGALAAVADGYGDAYLGCIHCTLGDEHAACGIDSSMGPHVTRLQIYTYLYIYIIITLCIYLYVI